MNKKELSQKMRVCGWICAVGILFLQSLTIGYAGCEEAFSSSKSVPPNTLTPEEKAAGWELLFDGKTTRGWRRAGGKGFPLYGWRVENGCLRHVDGSGGGDIVTERTFRDFELRFEWKIGPHANSGVKYFVDEKRGAHLGHEYQLLGEEPQTEDRTGNVRNRKRKRVDRLHVTGAFYDVWPVSDNRPIRPPGQWNQSCILVCGNHVEHWLNGVKILEYELGSPEVLAAVARSKFRDVPRFGQKVTGHILLQDHGGDVWFRNIKIRVLKPEEIRRCNQRKP